MGAEGGPARSIEITPLRASDNDRFAKQEEEEAASMVVSRKPGAAGAGSAWEREVQGTYHRVEGERCGGRWAYWTREPQDMWLVFDGARWVVGDRRDGRGLKRMLVCSDASVPSQVRFKRALRGELICAPQDKVVFFEKKILFSCVELLNYCCAFFLWCVWFLPSLAHARVGFL